ncbi:MAG: penicillin acylase family protein [Myxococcales bacterium]|nr:penicillin acylase family protein [Myxococcales bacterium]MDH3483146.1 penicillin acylase family protein [Myxococcales bacterium]
MRRSILCFFALFLFTAGCGGDDSGTGGTGGTQGDLEWPPDATVYFDEYDILNADCATDEDCAMVLGYYHALERFVQMDVRRRFSTGRLADILPKGLAELLDVPGVAADTRALFSTREGQPAEDFLRQQASPKTIALLQAYSAGVNKWIEEARNGDVVFPRELSNPPLDYGPDRVPEWTPEDSIATVLALVENLTNDESPQINAGLARAEINDDDKFSDLWSRRPLKESSILAPGWQPPSPQAALAAKRAAQDIPLRPTLRERRNFAPALENLRSRLAASRDFRHLMFGSAELGVEVGSNNWVVAPERTVNQNALLSNDPHLGMSQPATWYLAHLDATTNGSGEIHTAGTTFAGLPWVIVGQNDSIAWGLTTTVFDFSDIYLEELVTDGGGNPTGVMFQGEQVRFNRVPFTINFNDGTSTERELLFVPHHGAVREIDLENGTAITLRWTGNDVDTDINFLTELATATNVDDARIALENITTIGQNVVVVDLEGAIGWFPYNRLPKRTWATNLDGPAPPWLPLDGTGDYEWTEYFTLEELPQALNPAAGYIATANNDMTGALSDGDPTNDFDAPYQVEAAAGFRHAQIVNLIERIDDQHTTATMDAIISDVYSLMGEEMTPGILSIANDDQTVLTPEAQKVVNALEAWNYTCPTGLDGNNADLSPPVSDPSVLLEASGCAAFHTTLNELRFLIENNEFAPSFYSPSSRKPSIAVFYSIVDPAELVAGDVYWDNPDTPEVENKFQVMMDALDGVGNFLVGNLGDDETAWPWGRLHGLELESDLSAFGVTAYNNPPPGDALFANDGGLFTVDVANPDPRDLVQRAGPSTRFVCEALPSGPKCTYQLPGGQSGDIDSEFYQDLLMKWLANEPIDVVFDIEQAKTNASRTVTFE